MHLILWTAEKGYEPLMGPAVIEGAKRHGDTIEMRPLGEYEKPIADGGVGFGIVRRELLWDHQAARMPYVYIDKGYRRERTHYRGNNPPGWWRMVVNATHPTDYFQRFHRPPDRRSLLGLHLYPRRQGDAILLAGSSEKFHLAHALPHPTEWAQQVVRELRGLTDRPIIYRPKPSWKHAEPIEGAEFDWSSEKRTDFAQALNRAWCVVTYGSIASVDAISTGVACIVLGNAVARPISSTELTDIDAPRWYDREVREQWAADLAYCCWTPWEIEDGTAWATVKEQMKIAGVL